MFNGYVVDEERAEIIGPEGLVHIERLPLDVLAYLIENRDRVVSRNDLIDRIRGGGIVSDATVSTAIKQARKAVGDNGTTQAAIKTVHGRGFRFVAPLSEPKTGGSTGVTEAAKLLQIRGEPETRAGTGQPSLAARKFQTIRADPGMVWLAAALPSEVLSACRGCGGFTSYRGDPPSSSTRRRWTPQVSAQDWVLGT